MKNTVKVVVCSKEVSEFLSLNTTKLLRTKGIEKIEMEYSNSKKEWLYYTVHYDENVFTDTVEVAKLIEYASIEYLD